MDVSVIGIFIPIVSVVGLFITIIYLRKYQNQERMAMIERGVDPRFVAAKTPGNPSISLRLSLLFVGAGLGLLMGYFLDRMFDMEEVAYFSMLFIFGGLGLGASYILEEKAASSEREKSLHERETLLRQKEELLQMQFNK